MASLKDRIELSFVLFIAFVYRTLPLSIARMKASLLGWIIARVVGLRKTVAMQNLNSAFPHHTQTENYRIYVNCWKHFSRVGAEISRLPIMNIKSIEKSINTSSQIVLREALEGGKGVIVVSGHLGNWEWMGGSMARLGYPISFVVTGQSNPLTAGWLDKMRMSVGAEIILKDDAVRGILSAIRRNRVIAILCDQDAGDAGVFTEFFGRPASTPKGPAIFHLKTGTPILFTSALCDKSGYYNIVIEKFKFDEVSGDREEDIFNIMQKITSRLEEDIRLQPHQWLWLHRRWKTTPPDA